MINPCQCPEPTNAGVGSRALTGACTCWPPLRDAYRAYLLAYNSHQLKDIFNVHLLDLLAVAKSFGFSAPPRVRPMLSPGLKLTLLPFLP